MNHLPLIIKREYLTKVKNKSFIVMTFLSPMIFIALIALVAYLSQLNSNKVRVISILDESGSVQGIFKDSDNTTYNILNDMSLDDAKALSKETNSYGLLHIEKLNGIEAVSNKINFYSEESPSLTVISDLESKIQTELTTQNRRNKGIDVPKSMLLFNKKVLKVKKPRK